MSYLPFSIMRFPFRAVSLLIFSSVLFGCSEPPPPALPTGVQILTGTLVPTEISLLRRGSHLLNMDGKDVYLVESAAVSLSRYEHKEVVLEGMLSRNVDASFLPVLDVQSVLRVLQESEREWSLRSIGLKASLPDSWEGNIANVSASFHPPTQPEPVISLELLPTKEVEVPEGGVPIVIDALRSVRVDDEKTGNQIVYVDRGAETLLVAFTPSDEHFEDDRNAWLSFLRSIVLIDSPTTQQPQAGTGGQLGTPCGGLAGILCPSGYYCEVTNLGENIGHCERINKL